MAKIGAVPFGIGSAMLGLSYGEKIPYAGKYLEQNSTKQFMRWMGAGLMAYGALSVAGAKYASSARGEWFKNGFANAYTGIKTLGMDMGIKNAGGTLFVVIPGLHLTVEGTSYIFNKYVVPYTNTNGQGLIVNRTFWDERSAAKYDTELKINGMHQFLENRAVIYQGIPVSMRLFGMTKIQVR